ncbi:MAG: exosortase A [Candidatus Accumulibacter sp. UW26]|jgi:exosortase A
MNDVVATSPTSFATHPGWRLALPAITLTLVLIVLLFRETALTMAGVWGRSDTYAHGMIVPPITLWLIWRVRSRLAVLAPRPSYPAVLLLAGVGFAWLLGELGAVNALSQFALVGMLILAVPAVLGWDVARRIAFPLFFLLFAVPFGDFTQPKLMQWTADATVFGLRLSGIPVYHEGQHLVIPSGSWAVVEACSGVRYLIASLTVGTLFAYLTYQSLRRRLIFVALSIIVPVVANWARAYMIVMLGHLSGNKLAVGVDHLIYGWIFFGMVILALFWIGARWREDEPPLASVPLSVSAGRVAVSSVLAAATASVLVASIWPLAVQRLDHHAAQSLSQPAPLGSIAGWQTVAEGLPTWRPKFENSAASTQTIMAHDGRLAGLFVAYYRNQNQQQKMVSSSNVLVGSSDPVWAKVGSGTQKVSFNGQSIDTRTAVLRGRGETRLLVWQWYWVNGRWTSSDALAKAYTALSRLTGHGDDAAVIMVYARQDQPREAVATLEAFIQAAAPAIESALQQTMDAR